MDCYLGIDVGSVTTKLVLLDEAGALIASSYLRTRGRPIETLQAGLRDIASRMPVHGRICGVGATGSARHLAGAMVGADVVKNEITAQAIAALHHMPQARTVIEIGGQDSKLILLRDGEVIDFAMNTVCAAGTGSFLDQQAARLAIPIENFGRLSLDNTSPANIVGSCTVFAESDMVHKQQMGGRIEDILYGLCRSLARNYLNNLGMGKDIMPPLIFQGGVASNGGIVRAFEEMLDTEVTVHPDHQVTGAIGAALLARDEMGACGDDTDFVGFAVSQARYEASSFECGSCPIACDVAQLSLGGETIARWGGGCALWERTGGEMRC
ncbi:acyl-CoA dehydratase activase [Chloroflexota bacterium]